MAKVYHGSCLCRSIQYTITGEPFTFNVCHCNNCRKASGSAFLPNACFKFEQLKVTKGSDHIKVYRDTTTDSGTVLLRSFCPTCSACLFLGDGSNRAAVIPIGTVEGDFDWIPRKEVFPNRKRHFVDVKTKPKSKSKL